MDAVRLFLALALPEVVRQQLTAVQNQLKETGATVRWVKPDHFHLTVHFLGDLTDDRYPEVEESCRIAAQGEPFRFRVGGLSSFPKKGAPKTLWIGLTEGVEAWKALVRRAEEPFFQMGIPKNNGLVPHITLGRVVADTENAALWKAVQAGDLAADCGTGEAHEITLMESFLHPDGAQYQNRLVLPFFVKE